MSQIRSKYRQNDEFFTKQRMILIQRIQLLENQNEELKTRQISLKKINSLLIDALNSNPKVQEKVLAELRILNNNTQDLQFRKYQEEIIKLKDELAKKKMGFSRTQAETFKPEGHQEYSEKRSIKQSRSKLRQSSVKQTSQIDRYSILMPSTPSVIHSSNFLKPKHKRRLSERVYQIEFKQKQDDRESELQIAKLIKQKQIIQKEIENCQRKCNQDIQTQIESIVCIVKNRKLKGKENKSFRESKREEPLMRNANGKIGLQLGSKVQKFVTPRYIKRNH